MNQTILPFLLLPLFAVILYSFYKCFAGVRSEHQKKLQYLGPLLLFMPGILTKSGARHLILLVVSIALFIISFGALS